MPATSSILAIPPTTEPMLIGGVSIPGTPPQLSNNTPLPERLPMCIAAWRAVLRHSASSATTRNMITSWLANGYTVRPLPTEQFDSPNRPFNPKEEAFLDEEVPKLLRLGVIKEATEEQARGINNINVVQQTNGLRLVVNLTPTNDQQPEAPKFAFEDLSSLAEIIRPGDHCLKFDKRKMYFHLPIAEELQPWLAFRWRERLYIFVALPLGLQSAPWAMTQLLRPALSLLRLHTAWQGVQYLDDSLTVARTAEEALAAATDYKSLLCRLGFLFNEEKEVGTPTQTVEFLGFRVETAAEPSEEVLVSMLPRKRAALLKATRELQLVHRRQQSLPVRKLARYIGSLIANTRACACLRAATRCLHLRLSSAVEKLGWRGWTSLTDDCASELSFIKASLAAEMWTRRPLCRIDAADVIVTTDAASEWGWGGFLSLPQSPDQPLTIVQDQWRHWDHERSLPSFSRLAQLTADCRQPPHEPLALGEIELQRRARVLDALPLNTPVRAHEAVLSPASALETHNTILESLAILFVVMALRHELVGRAVAVRSDNSAAIAGLLRRYSRNATLNHIALLTTFALEAIGCRLQQVEHLPGELNSLADAASRRWLGLRGRLEWPLRRDLFLQTCLRLRASPQIDAFASSSNAQLPRYWSLRADPLAEGTDAFAQLWTGRRLYANPPFALIGRVLRKATQERPAQLLLIAPIWRTAPWWRELQLLATDQLLLPPDAALSGQSQHLAEPLTNPRWRMAAFLLQ